MGIRTLACQKAAAFCALAGACSSYRSTTEALKMIKKFEQGFVELRLGKKRPAYSCRVFLAHMLPRAGSNHVT
jgi:hypothetical protein